MTGNKVVTRDENVRNPPTIVGGESYGRGEASIPSESIPAIVKGFRTFSFRQRTTAMPESCAGGMKIPE